MNATLLEAALAYAARGLPIFPCDDGKRPMVKGGFQAASCDHKAIVGWWTRWPDALIGMPTGKPSGISVVDIDNKNGKNGFLILPDWEHMSPVIVDTRNGGAHLYFRDDGVVRNSTARSGIDVRGSGGYVIVPPSPGYQFRHGAKFAVADLPPCRAGKRGDPETSAAVGTTRLV
jgi:hypothetical protein